MKRIISIFLALIMSFSFVFGASAADTYLKVGEKKTFTLTAGKKYTYKFKAPSDGKYTMDCEIIGDASLNMIVYNGKQEIRGSRYTYVNKKEGINEEGRSLQSVMLANNKDTYTVVFKADIKKELSKTFKIVIKITKDKVGFIKLGKNETGKSERTQILFKPDKDGYYSFTSNKCDACDPTIIIEDNEGILCANDDSGALFDRDFDLTAYMKKDEVYSIEIFNRKPKKKAVSFTVSFNKKYTLKRMKCTDKGTVKIAADYEFYGNIIANPNGAMPVSGIKAVSKNPEIVSVYFDTYTGEYCLVGHKAGKSKITFTAANGMKDSFVVQVV